MVRDALSLADAGKASVEEVIHTLGVSEHGLSAKQVKECIRLYGKNILVEEKRKHILLQFLSDFKNPLVIILLCAAVLSFLMGDEIDGGIIITIVLVSVCLNFFQEYSAQSAAQALKESIATTACLRRDGKEIDVHTTDIYPGDIMLLNAGDLIPADGRVLTSHDCFVNQSALTGESFPVEKISHPEQKKSVSVLELKNCVFAGTNVITGTAEVLVLSTGSRTEFGAIAGSLEAVHEQSEFEKGIGAFSMVILRLTVVIVLAVFFINAFMKQQIIDSFMFSLAVAVGLTPELLPMIMSVTMGKGSLAMASHGVIVKKLSAIPNFGSMDVLCTDKTGTLTEDHIQLVNYMDTSGSHSDRVLFYAYLNSLYQTGIKNPLDDAVLSYRHMSVEGYGKIDEIPFDFVRKKMSVVVEHDKKRLLITKGAPEEIMASCSWYEENGEKRPISPEDITRISRIYLDASERGFRVLSIAVKEITSHTDVYNKADESDMELLGFIAFLDPAKKDTRPVLKELREMGIDIKVITGDNELVTKKICEDVGLPIHGIMLGSHLHHLTDDALRVVVRKTTIFARFSPDQKNRVIRALRHQHHVVGYMGDGINDAPSLQTADVGISVNNAVDVAKESADIILTHKSLKALKDGVIEGRKTFGNTMKYIMMGISSNVGNMVSVVIAAIFLPFLPMLPIQVLLNNLMYDLSQIAIPTDVVDPEYIRMPKRWDMKEIKRIMYLFGPLSSCFDILTFIVLYGVFRLSPAMFQTGWFLESLATQTFVIYVIRTRKLPFIQSSPSWQLLASTIFFVLIGWMIPYTSFASYVGFVPLPVDILMTIIVIVLFYLLSVEMVKFFYTHRGQVQEKL